jgi:hypothetical protein
MAEVGDRYRSPVAFANGNTNNKSEQLNPGV